MSGGKRGADGELQDAGGGSSSSDAGQVPRAAVKSIASALSSSNHLECKTMQLYTPPWGPDEVLLCRISKQGSKGGQIT